MFSYTIMYAVCGRLVNVLGTRYSFMIFVTGWSVANMLHALARTVIAYSVLPMMAFGADCVLIKKLGQAREIPA